VDFVRAVPGSDLSLVSGRGHYDEVVAAVLSARRSVWIATANLKELMVEAPYSMPGRRPSYRSVLQAFEELCARGVELRVLHASLPSRPFRDELERHERLVRGGLSLRACARVHLKLVIVDAALAYLGSANWTGAGLGAKGSGRRNFELGVVSRDDRVLDEAQSLFDHVWTGGGCRGCKLREVCDGPLDEQGAQEPRLPKDARRARPASRRRS
jgi:phosphatidylserine/phosphatidylglycerophosphate/cardiolipin synthase-like enzyme